MTDREAMQQALEALETCGEDEWHSDDDFGMMQVYDEAKVTQAITALRERLAQPEPGAWREVTYDQLMEEVRNRGYEIRNAKIVAPQPEQEPFGYFRYDLRLDAWVQNRAGLTGTPFYTSPPASKPWVGLTDAEIGIVSADIWGSVLIAPQSYQAFARAIEAKLKEKNT